MVHSRKMRDILKSWQAPKDAKSPLAPAMICDVARKARRAHQDSDLTAIYDWLVLGLSAGVRQVEYAQTKRHFRCCVEAIYIAFGAHRRMYSILRTRKVSGIFKRPIGLEVRYFHGLFTG